MKVHSKQKVKLFLTFMIIFTYFIHGIWWNDNTRLDLVKAIVDENRFEIDSYYNNTGDRSYYNGHYYSDKAPGQSFLSTPIYTLWKFIYSKTNPDTSTRTDYVVNKIVINPITGKETKTYEPINPNQLLLFSLILVTIFTTSLPSTLTVLLIYKISKFFTVNEKYRILVVITYGLGTLAFIYATIYFTHGLATFFVFFAFYLLFKLKQEKKFRFRYLILSGLFIGFAIVVDYTSILFALGLIVYIALSFKNLNKFLIFISTLFIATTPLLFYNYVILGDFSKLVYAYTDPDIRQDVTENLGFTGKINLFIVYRHLFDPYRGLLFYHPILLLSIIGFYYMLRKLKLETILIFTLFASFLLIMSGRESIWEFGSAFGGRYYLPIVPFLMLPLFFSIQKLPFTIFKIFLILSVFINFIGLQNWEFIVGDKFSVNVAPEYQARVNSFEVLANPLKEHYLPLFLKNGPRSRIFEHLIEGNINIDIRHFASTSVKYPFLSLLPLTVLVFFIWRKEFIFSEFLSILKRNPEIIFVPIIFLLIVGYKG